MKNYLVEVISKNIPRSIVLLIDLAIVSINYILSSFILHEFTLDFDLMTPFVQLPYVVFVALISFLLIGSYKGVIRHTGLRDTISIYSSVSLFTLFLLISNYLNRRFNLSEVYLLSFSNIIVLYLLSIISLTTSRYLFKALYNSILKTTAEVSNVIIYGAGEMGTIVYSTLQKDNTKRSRVRCFIDDDFKKQGNKIDRIRIYGDDDIDAGFIDQYEIKEIIIAVKNIHQAKLLEISDKYLEMSVKVKIVPPISSWVGGDLNLNQIKDVKIEDLLNRTPIQIDNSLINEEVKGKEILVTGAAGSIGSEIVRQLTNYSCEKIVLIDQSESALYDLEQDLKRKKIHNIVCYVSDVRDYQMMETVFKTNQPKIVFHAAAYKHVPLMEANPYEAVRINVLGTKNIADLACSYQIEKFVMVSTDKAVNPTNVMGATKRVAELYIAAKSEQKVCTKFITTRFGNVLGSNGSVIPLFKKQIAEGGPITLTHPEITRYFMTIPEACQLVIEAGCMGVGREIFIFDMGKSVKIIDLAKRMIKLSGLEYPKDIDIKITGLRPGEKLYEELLNDGENVLPTHHEKIMISKVKNIQADEVLRLIDNLCKENQPENMKETVINIKKIVPEFISKNSIYETLDRG